MIRCLVSITIVAAMVDSAALADTNLISRPALAIVLDCSQSMNEPAAAAETIRQAVDDQPATRMEHAQRILRAMLRDLADSDGYKVGLWLCGHRLAWERGTDNPQLISQDRYLEVTAGFEALSRLVPGDDVERIQPIKQFGPNDYDDIAWKLDAVEPWGEKPLYLAITMAMRDLAGEPATADKAIIVLTDGGNDQGLARYRTTHEQMLKALSRQLVPIHFIHVGPDGDQNDAAERKSREVAEHSGGTLLRVRDSDKMVVDEILSGSRRVASTKTAAASGPDASEVAAKVDAAKALLKPLGRSVMGRVVYSGRPVFAATLTLQGTAIPPVKADRQGRFLIRDVPAGQTYKLRVEAIALNKYREKVVDLNVESPAHEQPLLTVELR